MPGGGSSARPRPTSRSCSRTCSGRSSTCRATRLRLIRFGIPAAAPASLLARSWKTPQARALFGGVAAHAFSSARPPDELLGRLRADRRLPRVRLAGRQGRLAGDHRRARLGPSRARRQDRDGATGRLARRAWPRRRGRPRPRARRRGRDRGRAAAGAGRPRVPALPPRAGRLQARPRGRGRRALDERVLPAGRDRPRRRDASRRSRSPSERSTAGRCPSGPSCSSASSTSPTRVAPRATFIRSGSTRTCRAATPGTRARPFSARSSASPRASASGSWPARSGIPADLAAYNANYVGGDIITGANTPVQVLFRPRFALDPYSTGIDGVYICSAATPPGAGAHGMNGYNAARSALRHLG